MEQNPEEHKKLYFQGDSAAYRDEVNREFQEESTKKQAHDMGFQYIDISKTPLNPDFFKIMTIEEARQAKLIPYLRKGKILQIALEDPVYPATKDLIAALTAKGYTVNQVMASAAGIAETLDIYSKQKQYYTPQIVKNVQKENIKTYEEEIKELINIPAKLGTVTQEEALNIIDIAAMKTGSSDVHYEPTETDVIVRFRIDGILHEVFHIDRKIYQGIVDQVKYKSKMKLNITHTPQDGRYIFDFNGEKIAVRVSSLPTPSGESIVCRYLPSTREAAKLEELGFMGPDLERMNTATKISQGMVLITGPTGSGKSTTLYSMLSTMSTPENKVITLEDPVEFHIRGVTQSQIREDENYTFLSGLRTILRQDPDIIMLGEIRDLDTADTALQASLTGHVLLSTLHTNSALETIPRLINMGVKAFILSPALHTVVGQRLVRRVCSHCSTKIPVPETVSQEFIKIQQDLGPLVQNINFQIPTEIVKVNGCDQCSHTGYSGRVVLSEVVTISEELKNAILNGAGTQELFNIARKEGLTTMREDGYHKVALGLTTLEEVYRVTNIQE